MLYNISILSESFVEYVLIRLLRSRPDTGEKPTPESRIADSHQTDTSWDNPHRWLTPNGYPAGTTILTIELQENDSTEWLTHRDQELTT